MSATSKQSVTKTLGENDLSSESDLETYPEQNLNLSSVGQPQQRPPSLAQNPAISSQFRPSYPAYGMPPRTVNALPGSTYVAGSVQPSAHRNSSQVQSMVSQSTQSFIQQRTQNSFPFGASLGQHQSSTTLQQQQSSSHQQQTNGSSTSLPPHLAQTPHLANAQAASSATDIGLDPNDFPALGSTTNANSTSATTNGTNISASTTSYASQAGTGVPLGGAGGSSNQARDFTPDDFPALGARSQTPATNAPGQAANTDSQSHPPGLNGFQHSDAPQQHRQNLLGALGGTLQSGTPGMLNLGQSRNIHPGFQQGQTEADKQQRVRVDTPILTLSGRVDVNNLTKLSQAQAWSSPNANPGSQSQGTETLGTFSSQTATQTQQNGTHSIQTPSTTHLNAPPGVLPSSQPYSNGAAQGETNPSSNANPNTSTQQNPAPIQTSSISHQPQVHPQTPAQQVLVSAADRWGLLGLIAMLKNVGTDLDQGMSGIGTDLGTMGLDMGYTGDLYPTFITPWADQSAARTVEPDFHLPACYASVQAPPPGPSKASAFSDETLFFMFYSSPRDALQEVAAQELWNRNWRYHKDLRLWITKESGTVPSQKVAGGEQGQYTFWDPENWCKERKEMTVLYSDLEEKSVPAFAQGQGLVQAQTTPQYLRLKDGLHASSVTDFGFLGVAAEDNEPGVTTYKELFKTYQPVLTSAMSPQCILDTFKFLLKKLVQNSNEFTPDDLKEALSCLIIAPDALHGSQIGAFLTALHMHRLQARPEMITVCTDVLLKNCEKVHVVDADKDFVVDIVGEGGDGYNVYNVSTTAAMVAAGAGARVIKQGSRSATSLSGSADLLEGLGCRFTAPEPGSTTIIPRIPFSFILATDIRPTFIHIMPHLKALPYPSIFHVAAPLANPAQPRGVLLGVVNYENGYLAACAFRDNGIKRALVVSGYEKLDEISCAGPTWVWELKDGKITETTVTPEDFGVEAHPIATVVGGNGKDNAQTFKRLLQAGENIPSDLKPILDFVLINASALLVVAGLADNYKKGVAMALESITSGLRLDVVPTSMSWLALLPLGLVALTVVHASTTTNDPFRALALQVPKKPELPICCLRPQQPLDNNDEEILLSFEDWKQQQGDVINRTTDTNSNDDPAPVHVHDVPATPQREEQQKPPPHFRVPLTDRFNYASSECSARVHFSHRDAKSTSSILSSKRDRYMLSPCNAENQFVIVELCEDIRIDTIQLANFEFFSGVFKDFKLSVAKTDITAEGSFTDAGVFRAKNVRGVQSFHPPRSLSDFYRYIRIDFLSHYGTEFYCPVSLLRVYGLTHLEEWKWDAWEQESKEKHETPKAGIIAKDESTLSLKVETQPEQTTSTQSVSNVNVTDTPSVTSTVIAVTPTHDSTSAPPSEPTIPPPSTPIVSEDNPSLLSSPAPTAESTTFAEDSSTLISQKLPSAEMTPLPNSTNSIPSSIHSALRSSSYTDSPSSSSSIPKPSNSPSSLQNPGGESIYRTIMNRLTALEANHTLYVRYVEQQTSGVREVLRRMGEDVGRLEGIVRAQEQAHSRSLKVSEERIRLELGILIRRLDSLQSEIELEKTLGVVQVAERSGMGRQREKESGNGVEDIYCLTALPTNMRSFLVGAANTRVVASQMWEELSIESATPSGASFAGSNAKLNNPGHLRVITLF
ncbi:hypothetical protein H0H93_016385 [Arthromyces matolae]|nr:hypothetical protein H0H93_016385 [Arthromyces matolae]